MNKYSFTFVLPRDLYNHEPNKNTSTQFITFLLLILTSSSKSQEELFEGETLLKECYQDDLWLGATENGVYKFNGNTFEKFSP